jgi:hypothetical protein
VEPNQPNRELPDPDALLCVPSDPAPCFDVLPKSGSETLLLCAIFLPAPPLFSAISVIDCIEADGINDDMAITDWLFTNFADAGAAWLSLSLTDPCGSGGSGADGVPIMRDIDLSSEVKIFPTSFAGARFVPYPPYEKNKQRKWVMIDEPRKIEHENPKKGFALY